MPEMMEWVELKVRPFGERWDRFLDLIPEQFELLVERGNDERAAAAAVLAGTSVIIGPEVSVSLVGSDGLRTTSFHDRWTMVEQTLRSTYGRAITLEKTPEEAAEIALQAASMLVEPDVSIRVQRQS